MLSALIQRILLTIPVVFGVFTLTFFLIHWIPGDPVDLILGDLANPLDKQEMRTQLGLDQPLQTQYVRFLTSTSRGQLGTSLFSQKPVFEMIANRIGATIELSLASMLFAMLWGIPLGVIAAVKRYTFFDRALVSLGLVGMSFPGFFLGPLLIYLFAILLGWLPVGERGGIEHLILPALSLALPLGAILMRMTRASMLDVLHEDYVKVARAKGCSTFKIFFVHALRNALIPIITIVGLQFGSVLTGTVITETIFDWPGLGTLLFDAIQRRDYPLVQGCVLIIALIYIIVNFLTDMAYVLVHPKMRIS
ncbi:MAG: ABC transporter permease [Bdellovibrionaceae bacterium]|nr:ABC transporter permease [Pseudobdellovibrionaceae bacterium]